MHKICRWYGSANRRWKDAEEHANGVKWQMWGLWDEDKYTVNKTKAMFIGRKPKKTDMQIKHESVEQVDSFNCG